MQLLGNITIENNELLIGNVSTASLVERFGTPLFVLDENLIREKCRKYAKAFKIETGNKVAYAGKAFLTLAMCEIIKEENLNLDVVSGGELYTAYKSNFPMDKIYFHGNNKSYEEIKLGLDLGIGRFVVDNIYELRTINEIAMSLSKTQDILLRITPGIEAHTHEYIKTGQIDSKFGFNILSHNLFNIIEEIKNMKGLNLVGLHCHIGSQIFDTKGYENAIVIMTELLKKIKDEKNLSLYELNLGGGFGIYYSDTDDPLSIEDFCEIILARVKENCERLDLSLPKLIIEPGRSIIGNAGTTLYKIGAIKEIPGIRKYISVDGGMTDNIRPSLYNASYSCILANKAANPIEETVTIAGKCCESGDILIHNVDIPKVTSGDVLAVLSTGAYCYSMSSNYNKAPKPAIVLVKEGKSKLICKRESFEDIIKNEITIN
ncbi:diaminopimelate decarboxylase [Haloimpatiens sp. FM7315]|uniref:diaminopimelate decarboxylase n=1 Tax=Haloimpatiens sp. FM7315 TaxID=3298609 RepID=UPI0035A3CA70